ncbi:MAG TPA: bifunctional diaminohydroxyphosphoribosylaminopyrimidine deaminase/5-amino-6-(5-phosphoribosylamino)uracil reductase RibD, partial [Acidimicrobiia bacterium]|nr:bifunctional diaminohydroxyphosphoribosylaminopyrimidine deaminase/5-amino-6-(5-phosphoribosylamino)uracil reductase RibD [Acidimicrobiia bacterium]
MRAGVRDNEVVRQEMMRRAVELARGARRHTAPWPAVGCVLVRDGRVVGEGATGPFPAGPHAEVAALRAAGAAARGATAYCTLEPCDHHGNTPPCTAALIDAGVTRVVVAVGDPDERVAGRGYARLTAAGIEVETDVERAGAEHDLAPYLHHRRTGRAFVVAKVALTLDGRVAAADGSSQWITSEAARADAHELRADSQAIVIGSGTALADRPALTVR